MDIDPHYRLLLGRFSERVEAEYPVHEPLPSAEIPDGMAANMVQHRFRTKAGGWPLIQIGPGIMTVNETDGYTWDDFSDRCVKAVGWLFDSHPAKDQFALQVLILRYIDAVDVDFSRESVFEFLHDKMKTSISLPSVLFEGQHVSSQPVAFNWQASFPHDDPGGSISLRFAMGQRGRIPSLIWETLVETVRDEIPVIPSGFAEWLSKAHSLTDDWFFMLIEGELQRRFANE
jgi:uncharacterized protein (TIGR04255 family)